MLLTMVLPIMRIQSCSARSTEPISRARLSAAGLLFPVTTHNVNILLFGGKTSNRNRKESRVIRYSDMRFWVRLALEPSNSSSTS